jgi:Nucleotidyl transferase of unknown function (DUF2204)
VSAGTACERRLVADSIQSSLLAALADLMKWLDATQMPSMIIGGVAASILGQPRLTQDIDVLAIVPDAGWADAMADAVGFGILPRIDDALGFARRSRVLLLRHVDSGIDLDITFGGLSFEHAAVANSEAHSVGGVTLRLPRVEDLLVMKAIASRPKDLQDIEGLLAAHPEADVALVRKWVSEFAAAMSTPDMLAEFDRLVSGRRPRR